MSDSSQTIYLAGGCFWCTEAVFDRVEGVLDVESGYANGHVNHPSYEQVCEGTTGHAEAIKLVYDPQRIALKTVLQIFFGTHDPTTLNRQGNDVGTQYRSGVYYTDPAQKAVVEDLIQEINTEEIFAAPIVTEVQPLQSWWPAEDYHQDYFLRNPNAGYCAFVVAPKVHKLTKHFSSHLKASA